MGKYLRFYPGVYSDREKPLVEAYYAANRALLERGPVDVKKLIAGELDGQPGIHPSFIADEEYIRYLNRMYDPENPLYNDDAYADAGPYGGIVALPPFPCEDDVFMVPWPIEARDQMLVAGLNHDLTFYAPVRPGDRLWSVEDARNVMDLTPVEGSEFRSVALESFGSVYNHRGELVAKVIYRVTENLRTFEDPEDARDAPPWIEPDWLCRPDHSYTDADWDRIMRIWSREKRQGAEPLYWEDVSIGYEPPATANGPVDETPLPAHPHGEGLFGMGMGGCRTLKKEILDPETRKQLVRNRFDGIYRTRKRDDYMPPALPVGEGHFDWSQTGLKETISEDDPPAPRFMQINFTGRNHALRHINNFMGDHGRLVNLKYGMMFPETLRKNGYQVPRNPKAVNFLDVVPFMRGVPMTDHAVERDMLIIRSYVFDKYIENGRFFVRLAFWVALLTGELVQAGQATIELPSRNGNLERRIP